MRRFLVLCYALLFAAHAPSFGQLSAWHTAQPVSPNASVDAQGLAWFGYHSLDLRCDVSQGSCSWLITTHMGIGNGTGKGYDLWLRDTAGGSTTLSVSQSSIVGSVFSNPINVLENQSNGVLSRITAASTTHIPASLSTPYFMHSFLLTQAGSVLGENYLIAGSEFGFGGSGPGTDPFYLTRPTAIDDNPLMQNFWLYQEWPNAVINVTNVPEPASLSLLACGLVLFGQRVKRNRC